eukprot:gene5977-12054_t
MSGFVDKAFCFINSPNKDVLIGPNPSTVRGTSVTINAHPREERVIYPSGKFIVVRSLADPTDCFVYRGHNYQTTVAKFSPNGFWVASADISGKVKIWAWDNPEHITKLDVMVFAGEVKDLDWDFESKRIIAVGEGSESMAKIFVWDQGTTVGEISGHAKRILAASFKPSRPFRIMTGGEDFKTVFHNGPPFKLDHSNICHTNFVNGVRYSPNGNLIVSVGSDKKIQFYDGSTGQPTTSIENAHNGSIYSVAWNSTSTKIITASADKFIKLWNISTLECECTFSFSEDPQLGDMQVSVLWIGSYMVSISLNGNMNYLNINEPTVPLRIVQAHQVAITAMSFDRVSGMVYTGSYDGVICSYSISTKICSKLIGSDKKNISGAIHNGKLSGLAVTAGNLFSIGWDDMMRVTDLTSSVSVFQQALNGQPCAIATSTSSSTSTTSSGSIIIIATNKEIGLFRGDKKLFSLNSLDYGVTCVDILKDEEVAIGGDDCKTHIYSIAGLTAFTPVTTISTRSPVSTVAYSPVGDALAVGDNGRQVEVYERGTWTGRVVGLWSAHTSKVTCLAWSPDGQLLASGSTDETIYIWRFATPTVQLKIPFTHMAGVTGIAWIDESRVVSTGNDHCLVIWKNCNQF